MEATSKRFQDGHEILQAYVPGYEIPEDDESVLDPSTESGDTGAAIKAALSESLANLLAKSEKKPGKKP